MDVITATTDEKPRGGDIRRIIFWQGMVLVSLVIASQIVGNLGTLGQDDIPLLTWQVCGNLGLCTLLFAFIGFINGFWIRPAAPKTSIYNFFGCFCVITALTLHNIHLVGPQFFTISHTLLSLLILLLGTGIGLLAAELGDHLHTLKAQRRTQESPHQA
jgi:hypothetical protein